MRSEKRVFAKGEAADVEVAIHSLTLEGKKSFPFYVELLAPEERVLRGNVSIEVERVPAKLLARPDAFHLGTVRGAKSVEVRILNLTRQPVSLGEVACSIHGANVSLPEGSRMEPGLSVPVRLEVPEAGLPAGPVRGSVTVETGLSEHARLSIPVDGTALRR